MSRSNVVAAETSAARKLGHCVPSQPTAGAVSLVPVTSNVVADAGAAAASAATIAATNFPVQPILTVLLGGEPNRAAPPLQRPSVQFQCRGLARYLWPAFTRTVF